MEAAVQNFCHILAGTERNQKCLFVEMFLQNISSVEFSEVLGTMMTCILKTPSDLIRQDS